MHVVIYTTTSEIKHTDAELVIERGSFLCVHEEDTIYKYNLTYITYYIESLGEIITKDV